MRKREFKVGDRVRYTGAENDITSVYGRFGNIVCIGLAQGGKYTYFVSLDYALKVGKFAKKQRLKCVGLWCAEDEIELCTPQPRQRERKCNHITLDDRVLAYLKNHGSITSMQAFEIFGATRLAGIIYRLRHDGYNITSVAETSKNRYGDKVTYARYFFNADE